MELNRLFEKVLKEASGIKLSHEVIAKVMASRSGQCFEIWGEESSDDGYNSYIRKTEKGWDDCVPVDDDNIFFTSNEDMKQNLEELSQDYHTVWYIKEISPEDFNENTKPFLGDF